MKTICISPSAAILVAKMSNHAKINFNGALEKFKERLRPSERIEIITWFNSIIYFEVIDSKFLQYPENISALISFETCSGEFYAGAFKNKVARRKWATFLEELSET